MWYQHYDTLWTPENTRCDFFDFAELYTIATTYYWLGNNDLDLTNTW